MVNKVGDKSRRARRKEARLEKNKKKFDSWIQHHQSQNLGKFSCDPKSKKAKTLLKNTQIPKERELILTDSYSGSDSSLVQPTMLENYEVKSEASGHNGVKRKKGVSRKSKSKFEEYLETDTQEDVSAEEGLRMEKNLLKKLKVKNKKKTKFEQYLEMDRQEGVVFAEEDFALERKLAKKLKVKEGKLCGDDDDINILFEGIPSVLDSLETEENAVAEEVSKTSRKSSIVRKKRRKKSSEQDPDVDLGGDTVIGVSEPVTSPGAEVVSRKDPTKVPVMGGNAKYVAPQNGVKRKKGVSRKSKSKFEEHLKTDTQEDVSAEEGLRLEKNISKKLRVTDKKKTKFEQYLEMDRQEGVVFTEEDFALERKLAKKLKVKEGKLQGDDDDINMLFEGIPSVLDSLETEENAVAEEASKMSCKRSAVHKKRKKKSSEQEPDVDLGGDTVVGVSEPVTYPGADVASRKYPTKVPVMGGNAKYVAPQLRSLLRNESEEYSQIRRHVRGLLNRLSESNVEAITGEMSTIFQYVGRSVGAQFISEEVLASFSGGPRGNEQYAAVFAALVAGMSCLVGIDFGAKILASLAKSFEDEYLKEDNLSLRNLTLLLSFLYIFGVCSSDLIYDFMIMLSKRLTEVDVSTILTILHCAGMKLRSDDPSSMKNFILSVQNRVIELKAASENGQEKMRSKRMEFMLETICDIKNNKKRPKEDTLQHTRIKKWLQKLTVDNILIQGLKWSKLLDPDKKGQWWVFGDMSSSTDNIEEVARKIDREIPEAQKMLQLAAAQRMNTDARRAIFCIIMSGEDYVDAFEKLLRLDLPGKQDREIMRILVECCLQEKVFNKYYCVLASKLCSHDKNHKFTLQYCIWDHFKELESMQLIRSMHLSKFVAEMLASFSLSLAVLKVVDLNDPTQLTSKRIMHFRMIFEAIFEFSDTLVWNIFTRIAITPDHETLRDGIKFFISKYVVNTQKSFAGKFEVAKIALKNVGGVIL